jgi:hypothetical protein
MATRDMQAEFNKTMNQATRAYMRGDQELVSTILSDWQRLWPDIPMTLAEVQRRAGRAQRDIERSRLERMPARRDIKEAVGVEVPPRRRAGQGQGSTLR